DVAGKRADEPVEEIACRSHDGGNPRRGEDVPDRPDRATDVITDVRLVEPPTVVAHEVAHPAVVGGRLQERKRAVDVRRPYLLLAAIRERKRDDGKPGDVVDAVTAVPVGDDPVGVLHDAHVVGECQEMVDSKAREVQVRYT